MAIPVLVITGMNVPPYSYRGAMQTLTPIPASAQMARTVNGDLDDISDAIFRKYASQITSSDQQVPEFAWPGASVVVDCIAELSYKTVGSAATRPVVAGSSRVDGDFTFYRPQLTMRITNFTINHDEWHRVIGWTLGLEEV
jgi:hypothetical protein